MILSKKLLKFIEEKINSIMTVTRIYNDKKVVLIMMTFKDVYYKTKCNCIDDKPFLQEKQNQMKIQKEIQNQYI